MSRVVDQRPGKRGSAGARTQNRDLPRYGRYRVRDPTQRSTYPRNSVCSPLPLQTLIYVLGQINDINACSTTLRTLAVLFVWTLSMELEKRSANLYQDCYPIRKTKGS